MHVTSIDKPARFFSVARYFFINVDRPPIAAGNLKVHIGGVFSILGFVPIRGRVGSVEQRLIGICPHPSASVALYEFQTHRNPSTNTWQHTAMCYTRSSPRSARR